MLTASQVFADIETGCVGEVEAAANSYYSEVRGLTVRQSFYVYPNGNVVALNYCDGGYEVLELTGDDEIIFNHRYLKVAA